MHAAPYGDSELCSLTDLSIPPAPASQPNPSNPLLNVAYAHVC